ncbi:Indoleamine 2,3-dioxygenase [Lipomyces oligophaga]|uniref:Indoleamine 2,3-dioxygenase n=1 Tax=Lipomyces oligophaga TaxID=45792 RepID=UPI0034CF0896
MMHLIPNPIDYDISPSTGFVPEALPLDKLDDPYYSPWEVAIGDLPSLIMTRTIRMFVDSPAFPVLSIARLVDDRQRKHAHSILGFLAHAYIWAGPTPSDRLPPAIAEPLLALSEILDLPPLATYAGLCLWNHRPLMTLAMAGQDMRPSGISSADLDLSSLATLHTFTGSIDESWFYLVSTAIEIQGAPCISLLIDAIHACRNNSPHDAVVALQHLAESIDSLIPLLGRLSENCDPHVFYYRIRPFLAGSENMADAGLPHGVRYGNESRYRQYAGGSNAQSSLIQTLDIGLGITHRPTGSGSDSNILPPAPNFILEMRKYMPGPHRYFLQDLEQCANIREFVAEHKSSNSALTLAYDACLAVLRAFRDKHIQIVSRYIILQAKKTAPAPSSVQSAQPSSIQSLKQRIGLANATKPTRGTGGTALLPFLKQARDETGEPAAGSWAYRLLRDSDQTARKSRYTIDDDSDQVFGISGQWSMDDDYGGICHW